MKMEIKKQNKKKIISISNQMQFELHFIGGINQAKLNYALHMVVNLKKKKKLKYHHVIISQFSLTEI